MPQKAWPLLAWQHAADMRGRRRHQRLEILVVVSSDPHVIATPLCSALPGRQLRVAARGEAPLPLNQGDRLRHRAERVDLWASSSTAMHFQGNCAGTAWTGPGTMLGKSTMPAGITLSRPADPIFNYVAEIQGATYTITHRSRASESHVVVALSGRVSITPEDAAPLAPPVGDGAGSRGRGHRGRRITRSGSGATRRPSVRELWHPEG